MKINPKSSQYLIAAGIFFFIFLIFCIVISPQIFHEDLGISNYGINPLTVVPYFMGFLLSAASIFLAANSLSRSVSSQTMAVWGLRVIAGLQLVMLLIPKNKNYNLEHVHIAIATTLFIAEFILAIWFVVYKKGKVVDFSVLLLQALAGISAYLSLINVMSLEAISQLIFQLSFITLCVMGVRRIEE